MNNYELLLSPEALNDLTSISLYIVHELKNPKAAFDIVDKIESTLNHLKQFPFSGVECRIDPKYRMLVIEKYLAFYTVDESNERVNVMRILYGVIDYKKYL
ncbi:MAG: type II toxin-antitoxin system RelE/ParE family toxin [Clostridiaceae bacterium]|jgi:addiction module RelE/StbE family toxin|nr:type II toxin-antitoxin system RelE/ParE family toxin [Clostridiaceae bacterium]